MWPWEHLAVGYLLASAVVRRRTGSPPTAAATAAVALGTQAPDLVDKPLAWVFGVMPDGTTVGHSVFVAVPVAWAAYRLGARRGRAAVGTAFAVGLLSHLPADVYYPALRGGSAAYTKLLWPVTTKQGSGASALAHVRTYSQEYAAFLTRPEGLLYLGFEVALLVAALAVWVADGAPGTRWALARLRAARQ